MSLSLQVVTLERSEAKPYGQLFEECPHGLAQQSMHYSDVLSAISPDEPIFLVVRNNEDQSIIAGLPLYHFQGELGGILSSVPHAGPLGGILCRKGMAPDSVKEVYEVLTAKAIQIAEALGCISLSIITNPFIDDAKLYKVATPPEYVLKNYCQVIDLDTIFDNSGNYITGKSSHNNHIRRNLSKARDRGVNIQWAGERDFDTWYGIHTARHSDLGAIPLPKPLLEGIISVLGQVGMGGLALTKIDGRIVGGSIYMWNKEVADAFMPSGETKYLKYGINYAVNDFAIRYFKKFGIRWFNWQSSNRDSGVYDFKNRWGSKERYYQFLTWTFHGFEKVFDAGTERVSKAYRWHYVAPFEAISKRLPSGEFEKT